MITAGIDAGSRSLKIVVFDHRRQSVVASAIADQGVGQRQLAAGLFSRVLDEAKATRSAVRSVVATGYGRNAVDFADTTVTEITCHARGVRHLVKDARTVLEIGGQDSKCIILEPDGRVRDFAMNDRCAAGSGRFLEVVANRLGVDLTTLGALSGESVSPAPISSTCVVFAESEIIGLLAAGCQRADIAAGVQNAIASRVTALVARSVTAPVCFTGGVALQTGMVRALENTVGMKITVPPSPQFTGALGAALLAGE